VRLKVDVIVASVAIDAAAAQKATRAVPIVVAGAGDAVATGLVESLARPGGNVTRLSHMGPELAGKRLELLKEMVPKLSRVAVLWNPQGVGAPIYWQEIQLPAGSWNPLHSLEIRSSNELTKRSKRGQGARWRPCHHADPVFVAI
jgi:putative ABC transport system substrate-binding protein